MNFALTDEQEFLKEAARGALSRFKTVEAAREALDGGELPDLWPTAQEAGWAGLLISEEHGGAGLGVMDGMLVFAELGRVLAGVGAARPPARDVPARARRRPPTCWRGSRAASSARPTCPRGRRATSRTSGRVDPRAGLARAPPRRRSARTAR